LSLPFNVVRQDYNIPPAASVALDCARALAALAVMVFHLRHLFFVDDPVDTNALQWLAYKLTSPAASHLAVMVFFVMSGYLIASAIFRAVRSQRWSLTDYSIARLTRLWVVLIPALFLGAIFDQVGQRVFADSGIYTGLPSDFAVLNLATPGPHFAVQSLIANALFLQDTTLGLSLGITRFGSNGPLWSLAYEFTYYALFPALMLILWSRSWFRRGLALFVALAVAVLAGGTIVTYFALWLFGAVIAWLPALRFRSLSVYRVALVLASAATVAVVTVAVLPDEARFRWDVIVGGFFAMWIYVVASRPPYKSTEESESKRKGIPALKFFADFSFSLYVLHMPLLVFIHAWVYQSEGVKWQPDAAHAAAALVIAIGVVLYALAVASVTEFHTDRVRRYVRGRVEGIASRHKAKRPAVTPSAAQTPS